MKNIFPVSDLQRQAAQILNDVATSNEPFVITQRGRATAVLISSDRYAQIEEDLQLLDELELLRMVEEAKQDLKTGNTISQNEVKKRLNFTE
jgi:prevent-host-death family protein